MMGRSISLQSQPTSLARQPAASGRSNPARVSAGRELKVSIQDSTWTSGLCSNGQATSVGIDPRSPHGLYSRLGPRPTRSWPCDSQVKDLPTWDHLGSRNESSDGSGR